MPSIPLGTEAYARAKSGFPETVLRNFFLEEDKSGASIDQVLRLQRPGLRRLTSFPGPIRGIYQTDGVFGGSMFVVAGSTLYRTDGATITELGAIPDDGLPVRMAANSFKLGIVSANQFLAYDGETVGQIELPDNKPPIDIEVLNSYFILPCQDGTFYWQTPGVDGFEDANEVLNFATAEAIPDGLIAAKRLRDDLYLFGPEAIEVWQPTGNPDAVFARAAGRLIDRGCHSRETIVDFDNSLVFVGNDGLVYRLSDVPQRISTFGIEERIRKRSSSCSAYRFTSEGHKFYCLAIPGEGTFVFDAATEQWSEFSTQGASNWRVTHAGDFPLGPCAGDAAGGLFLVDPDSSTDDGQHIERIVSGTIPLTPARIVNNSLAIYGGGIGEASLTIRWKDARGDWSQPRQIRLREGSDVASIWRLGASRGPYRTFEIRCVSETILRLSGAIANDTRAV